VLPLVHVHSFIALLLVLPLLALRWRRVEWLALVVGAVALATPRLVQLASGAHGAAALGNTFPWLEPGWMSQAIPDAAQLHQGFRPAAVAGAMGNGIRALLTPQWWGFWFVNSGIVVPVVLLMGLAAAGSRAPHDSRVRVLAERVSGVVPRDLLRFCLPFLVIFAAGNVVVFQSWDWDNTKLFAYWWFAAALLVSALVVWAWRRGGWRATLGGIGFASVIMTGAVVMLRFMPWTPASVSNAGPFVWASADDRSLAEQVEASTAPDAVILTMGRHNDPLMTLAGRRTVVGYTGWLWSYGIDYRARQSDVSAIYQGCATGESACTATALMRSYDVSYVELPAGQYAQDVPRGNAQWWASTFPVVARAGDVTVYDVRPRR